MLALGWRPTVPSPNPSRGSAGPRRALDVLAPVAGNVPFRHKLRSLKSMGMTMGQTATATLGPPSITITHNDSTASLASQLEHWADPGDSSRAPQSAPSAHAPATRPAIDIQTATGPAIMLAQLPSGASAPGSTVAASVPPSSRSSTPSPDYPLLPGAPIAPEAAGDAIGPVEPRLITQRRPIISRLSRSKPSAECHTSHHEPALRTALNNRSRSSSQSSVADRHLASNTPSRSEKMALKFFSGHSSASGSSSSIKYFDIRMDNDYIVLRGGEDEASSAQLSGSVALCLTDILSVTHINLTLSGIVHMSWQTSSNSSMSGKRTMYKEKTFFEKTWTFVDPGKGKMENMPRDNYEWPFECILQGDLPESVEGMKDAWIIYRLKAEIGRKRGKDIVVRKPLRIVRTLDSNALELAHAMSVENIWPNKIEYSIAIPSKAVAFGSFVQVDFKLISLLKGLVIGNVSTTVREEQEIIVDPEWGVTGLNGGVTKSERIIASDLYKINPEVDEQIIDEVAEGYQFTRFLELPKSLNACLQDCNVKGIKIRHKVKFNVQLHNPDGHISELRANLPVSFYISPSLPINENNDLVDQTPQAGRAALANDLANSAPPLYGQHHLDQLYSDMDHSGYRTPGAALSSPGTPYLHSRHASSENLASLAGVANGSFVSPIALHDRLQDLSPSGVDTFLRPGAPGRSRSNSGGLRSVEDYFNTHEAPPTGTSPHDIGTPGLTQSGGPSQPSSSAISRRVSEEEDGYQSGARTPFPQYDHFEDLAKVPSYSTAVKTPRPRGSISTPPTYGAATREPSPPALAAPPTAHLRESPRGSLATTPSDGNVNGRIQAHRNVAGLQDEERRLRILQSRGR